MGASGEAIRVQLLGTVRAWRGAEEIDLGPRQRRTVLAVLALAAGRPLPRERIIDVLWPEGPTATAGNAIHTHIKHLRHQLEPGRRKRTPSTLLPTVGSGYALRVDPQAIDALRFRRMVAEARQAHRIGDWSAVSRLNASASSMWQYPVADLPGLVDYPAVASLVAEWRLLTLWAADVAIIEDRADEVSPMLEEQARACPLDEQVQLLLLRSYRALGRHAEALVVYDRFRKELAERLGSGPGAELEELYLDLLRQQQTPRTARAQPSASIVDSRGTRPTPAQLPPDVPGFAGRTEQLCRLNALLPSDREQGLRLAAISAVEGTAGVGKTALAVRWGRRVADWFPDGQLYIDLRGFAAAPTGSGEAIRAFLSALEVPQESVPTGLQAQIGLYRSVLAGRRVLIVLDNALDSEQVRPLLPGSPGSMVVVTSRRQLTGLAATEGAHLIELDVLTGDESRQLLTERLGPARVAAEPAAVDTIVAICGGLPLALAIVAAQAWSQPSRSLSDLARELASAPGALPVLSRSDDSASNMRAVFSWSYRMLRPRTARLFRLLGMHPGPTFSPEVVASLLGATAAQAREALGELSGGHLVMRRGSGRYALHDLLREYARELHDRDDDPDVPVRRLYDHYLHTAYSAALLLRPQRDRLPIDEPAPGTAPEALHDAAHALEWFAAERRVLLGLAGQAATTGEDLQVCRLAWTLTTYLERIGDWETQIDLQRQALEAARRMDDSLMQYMSHRSLGNAHRGMMSYADALSESAEALAICRSLGNAIGEAHARLDIAKIQERLGAYRDAMVHSERALELFRVAGHRSGEANALNAIGWFHTYLGEHTMAIELCRGALDVLCDIGDLAGQAGTLDSLGRAYRESRMHDKALAAYEQALVLCRRLGDRYHEADTLGSIGDTHLECGRTERAVAAWQDALSIMRDIGIREADRMAGKIATLAPDGTRV